MTPKSQADLWICEHKAHLPEHDGATGYFYYEPVEPYIKSSINNGWRGIESAPRDGTWVMGWWPHMKIDEYPAAIFYDEGIYSNPNAWVWVGNLEYGEVYPKFWQPLPQPPTQDTP